MIKSPDQLVLDANTTPEMIGFKGRPWRENETVAQPLHNLEFLHINNSIF